MKPSAFFAKLRVSHRAHEQLRREVIALSNQALSTSKRAIFAMHRDDRAGASTLLAQADALFKKAERLFKREAALAHEGAYRAALEEYAEALLFLQYLEKGKLGPIDPRAMESLVYLAGLCDTTGEIVRYTLRQVTLGNIRLVTLARDTVEMVIEFLLDLDATGYLRTKADQAKGNLKRLEEILYDLSLRQSVDLPSRRS
ncbi:hypothetical protein HZA85_04080 [Candidatus Uhrbacteria bacterium]|nr:hypothetical protein [Candidatus Uhrbacteria bacterium]